MYAFLTESTTTLIDPPMSPTYLEKYASIVYCFCYVYVELTSCLPRVSN